MEKTYIKITLPGSETGYVTTPQEASELIACMVENHEDGVNEAYEFATVTMTEEEFENLPEFTGF